MPNAMNDAAVRAAHAMVASMAGGTVVLRMPAPPVAGDDGEQLGMASPQFQDLPLWPVLVRSTASGCDLVVPADALEQLLGVSGREAVEKALMQSNAVVLGDQAMRFAALAQVACSGAAYLYRVAAVPFSGSSLVAE